MRVFVIPQTKDDATPNVSAYNNKLLISSAIFAYKNNSFSLIKYTNYVNKTV